MEKIFVDSIYKEKAKNDSNSRDLANSLNILSKTVFGDINRFVFELLQNADDSPNNGTSNKVEFRLYDNYLLFSHTGKHFDSNDVHGISRVGSRDSNKNEDNEKTGYKGIGFKSVFGSSDCVQIISNKFKFKFDKNYHAWGGDSPTFPWQVIPIWHEKIPEELNDRIDYEKVNTIIKIENKELIYSEIVNVFDDCQIILFLRHTSSISFYRDDEVVFEIHKEATDNDSIFNLIYNGEVKSTWYLSDFILTIPDVVRQSISKLSEDECPVKLKSATKTKLSLASLIEGGSLSKLKDTILYSYLPTKVELDFPYLVNGDFLLNAERTQLLKNAWNEYLIGEIAWRQLRLFEELSTTHLKYDFLNILKIKYPRSYPCNTFKVAFNTEYDKAIEVVKCIPDSSDNLILVSECLVDSLGYSLMFPEEYIFLIHQDGSRLANLSLKNQGILTKIGSKSFSKKDIKMLTQVDAFKEFVKGDIKKNYVFILFLRDLKLENNFFKDLEFVLDCSGDLRVPSSLYFPSESNSLNISFAETPLISNELLKEIHSSNDKETSEWLSSLNLTFATDIDVLRKAIFQLIKADSISADNTIEITRFAFKIFNNGELTENDYSNLRRIKLLTNNGMILANDSFLSDYYGPTLKLESLVPEHNYVTSDYVVEKKDAYLWKQFFIKLFVKEKITVTQIDKIERKALVTKFNDASTYLSWIDDNNFYDPIYYRYRASGQHSISNFRYFYFLNHLSNVSFAVLFWDYIISNWGTFNLNSSKTKYHTYGGQSVVPDYLSYFSRNFPSIPCLDNKTHKSTDVYAPRFKKLIKNKYPVANFKGQSLSKEQVEYIGLKNEIPTDSCIIMLAEIGILQLTDESKKQVIAIYDEMIKSYNEGNRSTLDCFKGLRLLSINNSFQNISDLYYFNVNTLTPPVNSDDFILLDDKITEDNKLVFCTIFDIPIINDSDLVFVSKGISCDASLKEKLIDILGFISVLVSHETSVDVLRVYTELNLLIESASFYRAENLSLSYKTESEVEIFNSEIVSWFEDGTFYYHQNWDSPLVLYSLSKSLCSFLSIDNLDRELALFLQINSSDIYGLLTSQGYVIPEHFKVVEVSDTERNEEAEDLEIEFVSDAETSFFEEFIPESIAKKANTSTLIVEKVPEIYTPSNNTRSYKSLKNDEVKIDIGRWAEEYVNKYLSEQVDITSVNWVNQAVESYLPYDFIIEQGGKEFYIEVKGTPSPDKGEFYLSKAEWAVMFEKKKNYQIYRLYNVGKKDDLKMKIIDSPYLLIESGSILGHDSISIVI
jgi:hypothetical protein